MHAVKGNSIGLLAMAMSHDPGRKKSRIRRSKEERKGLAESFIKKYQKLNSGDFPSLRLTHKEVGGSFYTVREIVREIIQENRVLGPSKFSTVKQNSDAFTKQIPAAPDSVEPQTQFSLSSDGTCFELDHQLDTNEKLVLNSLGQVTKYESERLDDEKIVYGKPPSEDNGRNDELIMFQVNGTLGTGDDVDKIEAFVAESSDTMGVATAKYTKPVAKISNEEFAIDSNGHFAKSEHQNFANVQMIDGNHTDHQNGKIVKLHGNDSLVGEKNVDEMEAYAAGVSITATGVSLKHVEPADIVSPDETCFVPPSHDQVLSEEKLINLNRHFPSPESQSFENVRIVSGDPAGDEHKKCNETLKKIERLASEMEGSLAEVETLPLRSAAKGSQCLEEGTGEAEELVETLEEIKIERGHMKSENLGSVSSKSGEPGDGSPALNEKSSAGHCSSFADEKPDLVDGKSAPNYGSVALGGLNGSASERGAVTESDYCNNPVPSPCVATTSETIETGQSIKEVTPISVPGGSTPGVLATHRSPGESNPSLDRINLESWAAKKSVRRETNPILAFFKALFTAFVKFWSE